MIAALMMTQAELAHPVECLATHFSIFSVKIEGSVIHAKARTPADNNPPKWRCSMFNREVISYHTELKMPYLLFD